MSITNLPYDPRMRERVQELRHKMTPMEKKAVVFVFAHISSENVQTKANSYICGGFLLPFGKIGY